MATTTKTNSTPDEHGSVSSYVVGLILSLGLTVIPYFMVTRQVASGTTLLLTILGLAVLQMIVQMLFFLHLGRGPKPFYNVIFFVMTTAFIAMVVGASILIMNNLYRNMSPQEVTMRLAQDENIAEIGGQKTGACQGNNATHIVTISGVEVKPQRVDAQRCDTITFKSGDGADYMLMFGAHDGTTASYGGLDEVFLRGDRAKIITLNESGNFSFHDHMDPGVRGNFTVSP